MSASPPHLNFSPHRRRHLALLVDPPAVYVIPRCTYAVSLGKTSGGMANVTYSNLKASLGSLIIGSLAATAYVFLSGSRPILSADSWRRLSGVVMMQGVIYFRMFQNDNRGIKLIVGHFCWSN